MKKTICLILALTLTVASLFAFTSCSKDKKMLADFSELVKTTSATKVVSIVTVEDKSGVQLGGTYSVEIEGANSISKYDFLTYRTVEEGAGDFENGEEPKRFKPLTGVAYFKDGKLSYDGDEWVVGDPVAVNLQFDLKTDLFVDYAFSEDGATLTAKVSAENAKAVLGAEINADGDVSITVVTASSRLISISVSCTTKSGSKMSVRTSYTYNPLTLVFPEADAGADD